MNIVVTGGTGFIGFHLAKLILTNISKSDKLYLIDNLKRHGISKEIKKVLKENKNIHLIKLDLKDAKQLSKLKIKIDRLYHLAAIVGVGAVSKDPISVLNTNTITMINVVDWFLKNRNTNARFLFSSTSEVYSGGFKAGLPIKIPTFEKVPLVIEDIKNPRFSYAISKLWGEAYIKYLCQIYKNIFIIVRYHNVYGPNMGYEHVIPQIVGRIKEQENPFKIIGGNQTRSFCWVEDGVEATMRIMESKKIKSGEIVHIGNQKCEIKIKDLYKKIFKICNFKPKKIIKEKAPKGSVQRRCPDVSLLKKLTNYEPNTSLDVGLKRIVESYIQNI